MDRPITYSHAARYRLPGGESIPRPAPLKTPTWACGLMLLTPALLTVASLVYLIWRG